MQVYPFAHRSGRPFAPRQEWLLFNLERTYRFISQYIAIQQVSKNGRGSVLGLYYTLSAQYAGHIISAQFVPETHRFCFRTRQGEMIKSLPSPGSSKEDILGYTVAELPSPQAFELPLPIPLAGVRFYEIRVELMRLYTLVTVH